MTTARLPSAQQQRADDLLPLGDWIRHHSLRSWPVLLICVPSIALVSGLVFGASEVVRYFTVNGLEEFYQTVQSAVPPAGPAWPATSSGRRPAGGTSGTR